MKDRPKVCIFCGSKGLSKEDYIPAWLKDHIPKGGWANAHTIDNLVYQNGKTQRDKPRTGRLQRGDKMIQKTLRVVCTRCNGTWMSGLNKKTQPIMLTYLNGGWAVLNKSEASSLAAWTTLHVMVREFSAEFIGISPQERADFYLNKIPGPSWNIWIAQLTGSEPVIHSTIGGLRSELPKRGSPAPFMAHTTAAFLVIGRLIIHCVATTHAALLPYLRGKYSKMIGFAPIWLGEPFAVSAPVKPLTIAQYEAFRKGAADRIMRGFVDGFH